MAKREEASKKNEVLDELEVTTAQPLTKNNVEFMSPVIKKKKMRKKLRKTKSAVGQTRNQFTRSYVFDSKRDKDKASVKVSKHSRSETFNQVNFIFLVWRDDNDKHDEATWNTDRQKSNFPQPRPHLPCQPPQSSCNFTIRVESWEASTIQRRKRDVDARQIPKGTLGSKKFSRVSTASLRVSHLQLKID